MYDSDPRGDPCPEP